MLQVWMPPCCLELILLLEQCVDDDELVCRTELQKQTFVVNAVSNSLSTLGLLSMIHSLVPAREKELSC